MSDFVEKNQLEREKFVLDWVDIVKENKLDWRQDHTLFVNSQILQARDFYKNLMKTRNGVEKIIEKFKIGNRNIIQRLKEKKGELSEEKLIIRESEKFLI